MAILQQPEIVLHNSGQDGKCGKKKSESLINSPPLTFLFSHLKKKKGTLRSAAAARGIKSITVEIGNPQTFQDRYVQVKLYIYIKFYPPLLNDLLLFSGHLWALCVFSTISKCFRLNTSKCLSQ
jgi:hypothetical protein